jgi:hypothetical protein
MAAISALINSDLANQTSFWRESRMLGEMARALNSSRISLLFGAI